jgi:hypothetical protein
LYCLLSFSFGHCIVFCLFLLVLKRLKTIQ